MSRTILAFERGRRPRRAFIPGGAAHQHVGKASVPTVESIDRRTALPAVSPQVALAEFWFGESSRRLRIRARRFPSALRSRETAPLLQIIVASVRRQSRDLFVLLPRPLFGLLFLRAPATSAGWSCVGNDSRRCPASVCSRRIDDLSESRGSERPFPPVAGWFRQGSTVWPRGASWASKVRLEWSVPRPRRDYPLAAVRGA